MAGISLRPGHISATKAAAAGMEDDSNKQFQKQEASIAEAATSNSLQISFAIESNRRYLQPRDTQSAKGLSKMKLEGRLQRIKLNAIPLFAVTEIPSHVQLIRSLAVSRM
jgi:hypothetical protein